jgi:hypothetical protein
MRISMKRHLIHWMAIAAILMGALAPSISQAIALTEQGKGISVEVCTTVGVKMTQVISTTGADDQQMVNEHCPFCLVHSAYDLPIDNTLNFAEPQAHNIYPQLFYKSPKPLFAWVVLPSRAPPTLA